MTKTGYLHKEIISKFNILRNESLAFYTNIKIGGNADYLTVIKDQQKFIELYHICKDAHVRFLVLGHGTNVFFADEGFRGLVVINNMNGIRLLDETTIRVESGVPLSGVNRICIAESLTGFEFSSGIPGTVGGAIYGNAGAYGKNIGECLQCARVLTGDGCVKKVGNDFFQFAYRHSDLKENNCIVLEADLKFKKGDYNQILRKVREIRGIRYKKLPHWSISTAGSFFKNLKDEHGNPVPAAFYLDAVDSKQTVVGDAGVHIKHANIFYNRGHASARDVLELEKILRDRVLEKFNIELQREVMFIK
ncbi:UDP-N-acetylmuramate dehydrogenase [candidate division KSB1 bacterium]|nr:UDP-N-acetylmuramate dehydrogenase [candidate division KSB1 bacterium]